LKNKILTIDPSLIRNNNSSRKCKLMIITRLDVAEVGRLIKKFL